MEVQFHVAIPKPRTHNPIMSSQRAIQNDLCLAHFGLARQKPKQNKKKEQKAREEDQCGCVCQVPSYAQLVIAQVQHQQG